MKKGSFKACTKIAFSVFVICSFILTPFSSTNAEALLNPHSSSSGEVKGVTSGRGNSFAENWNTSGDPIGGGPGYSHLISQSQANYIVNSVQDLIGYTKTYRTDGSSTNRSGQHPAPANSIVFVPSNVTLDLDGYYYLRFNRGVILASDRGRVLGGGQYASGSLIRRDKTWPFCNDDEVQTCGVFDFWDGGRITGFRAQGPQDMTGDNARDTKWMGGAIFMGKYSYDYTEPFEVDNNEIYGWPHAAFFWYRTLTGDTLHHNWIHHNRQDGYGYGYYPGLPNDENGSEQTDVSYNLFQENKHSTDGQSTGDINDGKHLEVTFDHNIYLGDGKQAIVNMHSKRIPDQDNGACSYAGWKYSYLDNMIIDPNHGDPSDTTMDIALSLPPTNGFITVRNLYLDSPNMDKATISEPDKGRTWITFDDVLHDPNWDDICLPHGTVTLDGIHTNLEGATIPVAQAQGPATITEGQTFTLNLSNSYDPDGNAIRFHEILWGDGGSVTDPAHRTIAYGNSASHAYQSGNYIVKVTAFNEYGIPSRIQYLNLLVKPNSTTPQFVAFVGPSWPKGVAEEWSGYYEAQILVNGRVAMPWRDLSTFDGYERIAWDATPINNDTSFTLTAQLRTKRNITSPNVTEPGVVMFNIDRFYLFNRQSSGENGLFSKDLYFSNENETQRNFGKGLGYRSVNRLDRAVGQGDGVSLYLGGWDNSGTCKVASDDACDAGYTLSFDFLPHSSVNGGNPFTLLPYTGSGNQAPTVSLTSPLSGQSFSEGSPIALAATTTDDGGIAKVEFYDGTTLLNTDTSYPYAYDWTTATLGAHSLTAKAYDNGNPQLSTVSAPVSITVTSEGGSEVEISGELRKWHDVTLTFEGPSGTESNSATFLNNRFNVTFTKPSGATITVPGYFAADGNAAETGATQGNKWRVHIAPDEVGEWHYRTSFRTGTNVAVSLDPQAGTASPLPINNAEGDFVITQSNKTGIDNRAKGLLTYVGGNHLRYKETGKDFIEVGTDSPENFLDYEDFDNTPNNVGNNGEANRKSWSPHAADYDGQGQTWRGGKGSEIMGAVNYLSNKGMNSFSFLTFNTIDGDDKNVFPFVSDDPDDYQKYDVSKLDQWNRVFDYADKKGMFMHIKTQETEVDDYMDGGSLGNTRKLYYRELVARFGQHLALTWNLGEEFSPRGRGSSHAAENAAEAKAYSDYLKALDPYDHHIVLHTYQGNDERTLYDRLLDYPTFDGASLQADGADIAIGASSGFRNIVNEWIAKSNSAGRSWIVSVDEEGGSDEGVQCDSVSGNNQGEIRRDVLWPTLFEKGTGMETYFGSNSECPTDLNAQNFRSRDRWWDYMRHARTFFEDNLPISEMNTCSVTGASGYCLEKPGDTYAVYIKSQANPKITLASGIYTVRWYNPTTGAFNAGSTTVVGGGLTALGQSPFSSDAAALVTFSSGGGNQSPIVTMTSPFEGEIFTAPASVALKATASDPDGSIQDVTFYFNGSSQICVDSVSPYGCTWNIDQPGSYALTAVARDNQGATTTSSPVHVTVVSDANEPPLVTLTSPQYGQTFYTTDRIPLAAEATDPDGSIKEVRLYKDLTFLARDKRSPYTGEWRNAPAGTHLIHVVAEDNDGATTASQIILVNVINPGQNNPPSVSMTSPLDGSTYQEGSTIALQAQASDPDGTVASVSFYDGSIQLYTDSSSPYQYNWTSASVGTHTLRAVAKDDDGAMTTSSPVTVTVTAQSGGVGSVDNFTLINAVTDQPVAGYDPIPSGAAIPLSSLPSSLSVRANVSGLVESVLIDSSFSDARTESEAPYSLLGDSDGDYNGTSIGTGSYSVFATPYSEDGANGEEGVEKNLSFTIVSSEARGGVVKGVSIDTKQGLLILLQQVINKMTAQGIFPY